MTAKHYLRLEGWVPAIMAGGLCVVCGCGFSRLVTWASFWVPALTVLVFAVGWGTVVLMVRRRTRRAGL